MVAALISKIIGMLYKSPLSTTLGSQSFALFQFAQNVYFILLMIASFSIPQAVSKIMAEKIAFHRYKVCTEGILRCTDLCGSCRRYRGADLCIWCRDPGSGQYG